MIMASESGGMNCHRLESLILQIGKNVEGENGFWQFVAYGHRLICVADEKQDRMRVMVAVSNTDDMTPDQIRECMEANFDRTLDGRYCISDDTLWAAFIHPLNSLSSNLFRSACKQVVELAQNFGSSYSSGDLRFHG